MNGINNLLLTEYTPKYDSLKRIRFELKVYKAVQCSGNSQYIMSGHTRFIAEEVRRGAFCESKNIPVTLERLMRKEMNLDTFVGGDVNIARMTKGKIKWIQRKQYCE